MSKNKIIITALAEDQGKRLDIFLTEKIEKTTRSIIQNWIENNCVFLNNLPISKASVKIKSGDIFNIQIPELVSAKPIPVKIDLNILFEDQHLLVINKPAGLVVHPGAGHMQDTLVNGLLHHCKDLSGIGGVLRPGIVHRLDKDTSGIMVIAKSDFIHNQLSKQFQKKNENAGILREYTGFCFHEPFPREGFIETYITRHTHNRQIMCVSKNQGKISTTHYKILKSFISNISQKIHYISKIKFTLYTGRTHQIRVHAQHIKCPLIGDPIYGYQRLQHYKKYWPEDVFNLKRQALHATTLGFIHPETKKDMLFETELPEDLMNLEATLDDFHTSTQKSF